MSDLLPLHVLHGVDGPRSTSTLRSRRRPLADPSAQRLLLDGLRLPMADGAPRTFESDLAASGWNALVPAALEVFQINVGRLCNMTCRHCHVDAGPDRTDEVMDRPTVDACLRALDRTTAHTVDITGGAPELNPHFQYLIDACVDRGKHVIDRCNLTILTTKRFSHLPRWFARRGVELICSLPHYRDHHTDTQRGDGAYERSIRALRILNGAGYGLGNPALRLVLVTNPPGASLARGQEPQEGEWKSALQELHGVTFDALYTLNNMPISRFLDWLLERGCLEAYMERLVNAFNPEAVSGVMCRNTLSVSWDGYLFDCDFNQMLDMPALLRRSRTHVAEFDPDSWSMHQIRTGPHCYGCTAGSGSSCGGEITPASACSTMQASAGACSGPG